MSNPGPYKRFLGACMGVPVYDDPRHERDTITFAWTQERKMHATVNGFVLSEIPLGQFAKGKEAYVAQGGQT